ncbi:unnamed protein product [Effrenium voratum]|nr:unnamed protein product [Effrenium voratum]
MALTPLGFHLAHMPVDVRIGKMLIYGSLCKCLAPILTIAACLSQRSPFIRSFNRSKEEQQVSERKAAWGDLNSDQLAAAKAYDKYQEPKSQGDRESAWYVCDRFGLSSSVLDDVAQLRQQFLRHLAETGFAEASGEDGGEKVNVYRKDLSLVRCVLCAGLFPNVAQVQRQSNARGTYSIFVSRQQERCAPHPSSLNFKQGSEFAANHGWLLFHDKVKTSQVYLHDTTLVGSLPILLFGGELKILPKERNKVTVDGMVFEAKDEKAAVLFKELRRELDRLLLLKVANPLEDLSTTAEPLLLSVTKLLQWEDRGSSGKKIPPQATHFTPTAMGSVVLPVLAGILLAECSKFEDAPARASSVLQTSHQVATTQGCKSSEVLCAGSFYPVFPWDYACFPLSEGCPVACGTGEVVCTTPQMCENCSAVKYCSKQPCPVVCSYQELLCEGESSALSCAPLAEGCPVGCAQTDYQCRTPAKCPGCAAVNWCSSGPCPALCEDHEVSCPGHNGSHGNSSFCVPSSRGCPAECKDHEYHCHRPSKKGEAGLNFCSPIPCAPSCNKTTEVVCGSSNGAEFCMPKAHGCPVNCTKPLHTCYSPPPCENCTGINWCSKEECPALCNEGEISCTSHNGTNLCVNRSQGCPASCHAKEEKPCHWPPQPPNFQGMNWCSLEPCPAACNETELACTKEDGTGVCVAKAEGCPVHCHDGEFTCHQPPPHVEGYGSNWCSTAPCAPNCTKEEVACGNDEKVYSCHKKSEGCPVKCSHHEHECQSAANCTDCVAVNWCSTDPCPSTCKADEVSCPHGNSTLCRPKADGCPAHCEKEQNSCFTPPACEGCVGMHWCSDHLCPVVCNSTEMGCLAENGTEFCVATAEGCPVSCREEEYVCHLAPECSDCVGTNWCSQSPCATTM